MNKINIFSLGGLQTIVKRCANANLSFDDFFSTKTSEVAHYELMYLRSMQLKLLLGVLWGIRQSCLFSLPGWSWLKRLTIFVTVVFGWINCFQYCSKHVFKGPWWTIYSWYYVFVLSRIVLHFNVSFANPLHFSFLFFWFKTKMPLTVLNCHTILHENVYRLLCKSMLPTMFIKLCVKLKHIHLASYVGVEKIAPKVNAALLW